MLKNAYSVFLYVYIEFNRIFFLNLFLSNEMGEAPDAAMQQSHTCVIGLKIEMTPTTTKICLLAIRFSLDEAHIS